MSAHTREKWEAAGLRSSEALSLVNGLSREKSGYASPTWTQTVEARAIAEFVGYHGATTNKASGAACREMMVVACARFGVDPTWFYMDEGNTVDEDAARALRADVAHYRIMHGLDDE